MRFIFALLLLSAVHLSAQPITDIIDKIINPKNDSLFRDIHDYSFHALKYRTCVGSMAKIEAQADSIRSIVENSSLASAARRLKRRELANLARRTRDILTGVFPDEMKILGLWGFDILDNREAPRGQKEEGPPEGGE